MDFIQAFFLGVVQGITEFLPVSSSGHLYLVQGWFGIEPNLALEGWLHLATLLAVLIFFWKDVWALVLGFGCFVLRKGTQEKRAQGVFAFKLGVATLCTVLLALVIEPFIHDALTFALVGATLVVTAFLIWGSEAFRPKKENLFSWKMVPLLGVVQAIAILPGISRSGITVALLVALGINRTESAKISFLLSIPTIAGAFVFLLLDPDYTMVFDWPWILSGVVAFVAALAGIKWMMNWITTKWTWFAWYCLAVGVAVLVYSYSAV